MIRYASFLLALLLSCTTAAQTRVDAFVQEYKNILFYPTYLSDLYPYSQRKWQSAENRKELENQLALLILADLDDDLEDRYNRLQRTHDLEYDVLATDTLLYLSVYRSLIKKNGTRWLFGGRLGNKLDQPSVALIQSIQQHFEENTLDQWVSELRPQSKQYQDLYKRLYRYYDREDRKSVV